MVNTTDAISNLADTIQPVVHAPDLVINSILFLLIILAGVILGKLAKYILKKIINKFEPEKIFPKNIIDLGLTIIKWTVYIIFINIALTRLQIPYLSEFLYKTLSTIPLLVVAFVIIVFGYSVATFLRRITSKIKDWQNLGIILYFFTIYSSLVISIQLIFLQEKILSISAVLLFTAGFVIYLLLKK